MHDLSLRQRRIIDRWPNTADAHRILSMRGPSRTTDAAGNKVSEGPFWRITTGPSVGGHAIHNRKKAQPLRPDQQARYDKLMATSEQLEAERRRDAARKRDERVRRVLARNLTMPAEPLDQKIALQLSTQNERHRPMLRRMYLAAVGNNELFFGGKLALPIIAVDPLKNSLANCAVKGRDCLITFDTRTFESRNYSDLADTLLHEQIHQAIGQVGDKPDGKYEWHHAEFAAICNRIAKQRGWPDCSAEQRSGPFAARYWPPRTHLS